MHPYSCACLAGGSCGKGKREYGAAAVFKKQCRHDRHGPRGINEVVYQQDRARIHGPVDGKHTIQVAALVEPILLELLGFIATDLAHHRSKLELERLRKATRKIRNQRRVVGRGYACDPGRLWHRFPAPPDQPGRGVNKFVAEMVTVFVSGHHVSPAHVSPPAKHASRLGTELPWQIAAEAILLEGAGSCLFLADQCDARSSEELPRCLCKFGVASRGNHVSAHARSTLAAAPGFRVIQRLGKKLHQALVSADVLLRFLPFLFPLSGKAGDVLKVHLVRNRSAVPFRFLLDHGGRPFRQTDTSVPEPAVSCGD